MLNLFKFFCKKHIKKSIDNSNIEKKKIKKNFYELDNPIKNRLILVKQLEYLYYLNFYLISIIKFRALKTSKMIVKNKNIIQEILYSIKKVLVLNSNVKLNKNKVYNLFFNQLNKNKIRPDKNLERILKKYNKLDTETKNIFKEYINLALEIRLVRNNLSDLSAYDEKGIKIKVLIEKNLERIKEIKKEIKEENNLLVVKINNYIERIKDVKKALKEIETDLSDKNEQKTLKDRMKKKEQLENLEDQTKTINQKILKLSEMFIAFENLNLINNKKTSNLIKEYIKTAKESL